MSTHPAWLTNAQELTRQALEAALPPRSQAPTRLHAAMRHATFAGGKRIRPALVLAVASDCSQSSIPDRATLAAVAAIELLHTYTLVHDDLPAMDDDDLRRGQATVHKAFDEATAILAGDGLQAAAFTAAAQVSQTAVQILAAAATAVVAGQQDDLSGSACLPQEASKADQAALLNRIHRRKTGALLAASLQLGACTVSSAPDPALLDRLAGAGANLGLAFQYIDDLLDVTAMANDLGKTPGKDAKLNKLTAVSLFGAAGVRQLAEQATKAALDELTGFPQAQTVANWLLDRQY